MTLTHQAHLQILNIAQDSRHRTLRSLEAATARLETEQAHINDLRNIMSTLDYCIELLQTLTKVPTTPVRSDGLTIEGNHPNA